MMIRKILLIAGMCLALVPVNVNAETVTIHVGVTVVNADTFGLTDKEFLEEGTPTDPNSTFWKTKQCCLQLRSHRGLMSDYCKVPEMEPRFKYCENYLK